MLKFYVKLGVSLTKIHRLNKFKQDYIGRDYFPEKILINEQQLKLKRKRM